MFLHLTVNFKTRGIIRVYLVYSLLQVVLSSSPQSEGRLAKIEKAPFIPC
jgi:hypothetical protein